MAYIDCQNCYHGEVCQYRRIYHDTVVACKDWQPTSDVAPRSEVEALQEVNANLQESLRLACEANKDLRVEYENAKTEAAKEIFEEIGEYANDFAAGHIDDDNFLQAIYNLRAKYTNPIHCKDCQHLMFSDCYGECSKGHKGIVKPDDSCEYGVKKYTEVTK